MDKASISFNNKTYEFPVVSGTEDEYGIDISSLRKDSGGLITFDRGFKNTGSCKSSITFLDGENSILRYRGYSIEDLADKASFLEVTYLLIFGELPTKSQLDQFHTDIKEESHVDEEMKKILDGFPRSAHPMGVVSSLTSALIAFNPSSVNIESDQDMYNAIVKLVAKFPVLCSWALRKKLGRPLDYGDDNLDFVENIVKMMFKKPNQDYKVNPIVVNAGLFASISAGVSALWGPLHGGANQAVIEMLEGIKNDGGDTKRYLEKAKDKDDPFRLMGFGHRVYKNYDPRAKVIKKSADEVLGDLGIKDEVLDIAKGLEEEALKDDYFVERKLYPNVDFYSGIIYRALGIPVDMFTVMFALGRLPGWIAQWREMRQTKEPIGRPRQIYTGENHRAFKSIDNR